MFFGFDREERKETAVALLGVSGLTQFLITRIGFDVLKDDRLAGLRHSPGEPLATSKDSRGRRLLLRSEGGHSI
jgi:hypothetical protein